MKFAFKFARDAVVSQISWYAETTNGKSLKETCIICFEDTEVSKMFSVDHCWHRYCFSCMRQHVEMKLLNGMVAKCPHEGCKSEVNTESCGEFLAPELVKVMSEHKKESFVPVSEKVYCPYPRCSTLMSKKEVLEYTNNTLLNAEQSGVRKCMKCCKFFCINCRVPWHNNMTCNGYKRSNPQAYAEDQKLKSLATKKLWRGCPRCNHMVELAEGCYHITCRYLFLFHSFLWNLSFGFSLSFVAFLKSSNFKIQDWVPTVIWLEFPSELHGVWKPCLFYNQLLKKLIHPMCIDIYIFWGFWLFSCAFVMLTFKFQLNGFGFFFFFWKENLVPNFCISLIVLINIMVFCIVYHEMKIVYLSCCQSF